jgi:hypothetical protein
MELPESLINEEWAQKYLSYLEQITDQDLFEEAFKSQKPDGYNGSFSARGWFIAELSKMCLHERFMDDKRKIRI